MVEKQGSSPYVAAGLSVVSSLASDFYELKIRLDRWLSR